MYLVIARADCNPNMYKTDTVRWSSNKDKALRYASHEGATKFAESYQRKLRELNMNEINIIVKEEHEV